MSKLNCRTANTAGAKSELDLLTPNETKMLLEFMLYNMDPEMRHKFMVHHPRLYNVLYPGTLKITVQIGSDGRVVCDE
jgi:hypothetical protein